MAGRVSVSIAKADNRTPRTILVAEDHGGIRALAGGVLRDHGYQVLEAADGQEALELLARHSKPIDLLLTDWCMPGMDGGELCSRLGNQHPETRILVMSGFVNGKRLPDTAFLQKPFTVPELVRKVEEVLHPE